MRYRIRCTGSARFQQLLSFDDYRLNRPQYCNTGDLPSSLRLAKIQLRHYIDCSLLNSRTPEMHALCPWESAIAATHSLKDRTECRSAVSTFQGLWGSRGPPITSCTGLGLSPSRYRAWAWQQQPSLAQSDKGDALPNHKAETQHMIGPLAPCLALNDSRGCRNLVSLPPLSRRRLLFRFCLLVGVFIDQNASKKARSQFAICLNSSRNLRHTVVRESPLRFFTALALQHRSEQTR